MIGELYIGGDGLAKEYIANTDLNHSAFIKVKSDNFNEDVLYKTGDHVFWRNDGNLVFMKRMDDQLKIRGYRINLNNVSKTIQSHPLVNIAYVAKNDKIQDNNFYAFITINEKVIDYSEAAQKIKRYLLERLPNYMCPIIRVLPDLPLNYNGKIDKKSLFSQFEENKKITKNNQKTPSLQLFLIEFFERIFNNYQNLDEDFILSGANSLTIATLSHEINKLYGIPITIPEILSHTKVTPLSRPLMQ
ncbi:MAG: non-ribosomal peptide synthetase [Gammaproteobacteria bacterium]|nr:non-ribosomal peptide synthetase [Gammaproteobacteria bacterium]